MNRGIILVLLIVIAVCAAGLYLLQHGASLFAGSPSEERIAYVSTARGNEDIWTMRTDGTDKRPVTEDAASDRSPAWSPNAVEIASVSSRDKNAFQLFVSAWDGRYAKQLTKATGTKDLPKWSSDGARLAYIASGRVYIVPRHGGTEEQVFPPVSTGVADLSPPSTWVDWSPQGSALAFLVDADQGQRLYVMEDLDRDPYGVTAARRLSISWAPKGRKLVVGLIGRKKTNGILIADLERVSTEEVWMSPDGKEGPGVVAWSPDGERIAFEVWSIEDGLPRECLGIYAQKPGSRPTKLVSGNARNPVWSPDGGYVAFERFREDGGRDIWRVRADGSDPANLTDGKGDNYQPAWSPAVKK